MEEENGIKYRPGIHGGNRGSYCLNGDGYFNFKQQRGSNERKRKSYYGGGRGSYMDENDEVPFKRSSFECHNRVPNEDDFDHETHYVVSSEKPLDFPHSNARTKRAPNCSSFHETDNAWNGNSYLSYRGHRDKQTNVETRPYSSNYNENVHYRRYGRNSNKEEHHYYASRDSYAPPIYYSSHVEKRARNLESDGFSSTEHGKRPRNNAKSSNKNNSYTSSEDVNHFSWYVGQYLTQRYRILSIIGEGTFGRVFECEDLKRKKKVAIKVVKNVSRYTEAAKIEARMLRDINMEDAYGEYSFCVMLHNAFLYNNSNMCLVFEKLGQSLYEFLRGNCSRGFFLADIQNIAEQILLALSFLRRLRLTHTDLKLENVLLTNNNYVWVNAPRHPGSLIRRPVRPEIRLIDFGSATYEDDYHGSIINTRQYRAPEVILDIGWDISSDMWGFGCILMELYTGILLFRTHEHLEHLAMIERIVGPFPNNMLRKAYNSTSGRKYVRFCSNKQNNRGISGEFKSASIRNSRERDRDADSSSSNAYTLNWPEGCSSNSSFERVSECRPLEGIVDKKHMLLAKFARYVLNVDPVSRPTPEMALRHEFFRYKFTEEIY